MRKIFLLLFIILSSLSFSGLAKQGTSEMPDYEITGDGTGAQGTYLINVTVITKDKNISDAEIARCAVHGVLFRGFTNKEMRQSQKPLAGSGAVESSNLDYFNSFFADGGLYRNYVSEVSGSRNVVKSGKLYKVSSKVTVHKDQLRKDLEQAGVIRGLNSAF